MWLKQFHSVKRKRKNALIIGTIYLFLTLARLKGWNSQTLKQWRWVKGKLSRESLWQNYTNQARPSERLQGCGPTWVSSLKPSQGLHHPCTAEGGKSPSPWARPAHVKRRWVVAVRLLSDEVQCPGPLAFCVIIQVSWVSAHPALLILCTWL